MLGNVATPCESPLGFDPLEMKGVSSAEAGALLRRGYRQGGALETVGRAAGVIRGRQIRPSRTRRGPAPYDAVACSPA